MGLSQHAVWKAKIFNVNFVPPPLSSGIHSWSSFPALPLLGAEIGGHTTSLSEQILRATALLGRAELARRWLLSWPGCRFLGGTIFGRFFILALYHKPVGQMTAELQA